MPSQALNGVWLGTTLAKDYFSNKVFRVVDDARSIIIMNSMNHAELVNEILTRAVSAQAEKAAETLEDEAIYTTTALLALAQFLENNGDSTGAELIRKFGTEFAEYEATTL